ncbi:MAG: MFS transporter [Alphaproteobacteria bacterium]|nr:MFS transporter [Alphaproteobacteria bacterium]
MIPAPTITEADRRRALVFLFMVSLFNYGDRNMLGVLVPAIKADLQLSDTQIGFITGIAFSLFYAVMGIPIARMADTMSRKTVVSVALAVWSAMTVACGLAQNFVQLALARVMVGVGEAGATPPSHAMIADLFPKARRAGALAVYSLGSPVGLIMSYLLGAWITQTYGWRAALFAFGLPGIAAAVVLYKYLKEPPRGHSEDDTGVTPVPAGEAIRHLLSRPAFRQNAVATGIFSFLWFGLLSWTPSFFVRTHGMSIAEVGAWLSLPLGLAQLAGTYLGGWAGNRFGGRDMRWYAWWCAAIMVGSAPFYIVVFTSPDPTLAMIVLSVPILLSVSQGGPQHWMTQAVAGPRMRATATALYLLIVNLISGLGAQTIGFLSDQLAPRYGQDALGLVLMSVGVVASLWAATHFLLINRTLAQDIAAAR